MLFVYLSVPPPTADEKQDTTAEGGVDGKEQAETVEAPLPVSQPPPEQEEEQIIEELNEFEENIRGNILEDEPLMYETLDEIVPGWWKEEPFK